MVKPILQLYPVLPAADEAARQEKRPFGRNAEAYQETVHGMTELVKIADELGFWGASSIEHHFHSEGYEVGPSPGILNAHWAAVTRRIRIGALGYTMSAQNPFRVAEDTAIIDHLARGRSFVGFSRGYQSRWTNILGQHVGVKATLSPQGMTEEEKAELGERLKAEAEADRINREVFEENVDIVMKAWTEDAFDHRGRWEVPAPYDSGLRDWNMADTSRRLGAPGEIDDEGVLRKVSVVPSPYQKPHPPVFVASAASQATVEYCGARGYIPAFFSSSGRASTFGQLYVDNARERGLDYVIGQNQALVRWMQIGDTEQEARDAIAKYDAEMYKNLYQPLTPHMGLDPDNLVQSVIDSGLWMAGTVEQVRDQFVKQWTELPAEYCVLIFHYAQQPLESVRRNLELFMEHIKPALDELTDYDDAPRGRG